jgi:hypothetical protein
LNFWEKIGILGARVLFFPVLLILSSWRGWDGVGSGGLSALGLVGYGWWSEKGLTDFVSRENLCPKIVWHQVSGVPPGRGCEYVWLTRQ